MSAVRGGAVAVDDDGLVLAEPRPGLHDVLFDGEVVWTFEVADPADPADAPAPLAVPWPANLRPWLSGTSHVTLRHGDRVLDAGEVVLGEGGDRIRFVDRNGVRIVLDKWGILQRPFQGRDPAVVHELVTTARRIVEVVERDVGVRLWMAFGTLLGAVREGGVIGHDADIDLAYLSEQGTPAAMAREMFAIRRALVRAGFHVVNKTGSFVTVTFKAGDRSLISVDVYTCFHVGDLLYETATVRAPIPRDAVEPLQELPFEGVPLPAPADPDRLLAASYGPSWRTPDPSFRHRPGPEVVRRFDGWFGSVMRQRREWEVYWRDTAPQEVRPPSAYAVEVAERLPAGTRVVDLGCGDGADALHLARRGHRVVALDYARGPTWRAARIAEEEGLPLEFARVNLLELRDTLTAAAWLRRRSGGPWVLYARSLLDALPPEVRDDLLLLARLLLRGGGQALLEFQEGAAATPPLRFHGSGGRHFRVDPAALERRLRGAGAAQVRRRPLAAEPGTERLGRRWRVEADWGPADARLTVP